jgi:hypothetical protein
VAQVWTFARSLPNAPGVTWWRVRSALRRSDPSPIYVCEHRPRQLRRIQRLLALARIKPARCLFITRELADVGGPWVDRLGRFGARTPAALPAADYPLSESSACAAPHLRVLDSERTELRAWLSARGWAARSLILIQPGNFRTLSRRRERWKLHDDKAWPQQNWAALLHKLHAAMPDALIILCGAPAEGPMLQQLELLTALPQVAIAELPLRRLLALCESAHSMISIDTGPAHVAAALGLPLVVMYGAESPRQWLPRSPSGCPCGGCGLRCVACHHCGVTSNGLAPARAPSTSSATANWPLPSIAAGRFIESVYGERSNVTFLSDTDTSRSPWYQRHCTVCTPPLSCAGSHVRPTWNTTTSSWVNVLTGSC